MLFNSLEYAFFYSIFFVLFFFLRDIKHQIFLVCVGSFYFYGAWSATHVLLLFAVCVIAYSSQFRSLEKYSPAVPVISLLSILFVFKYYNFFADSLGAFDIAIETAKLVLPVGISFYIFQAISYVVDRKRQHIPAASLTEVIAYISFFPQLVAGPIVRASVFMPQLKKARVFSKYMFCTGLMLFAMGLFKKIVIADNVGLFVDTVYGTPGSTTAGNHILAFYLYAVQIYYDFCGYSEMAIGIARTLGFKFPRNFARPYMSASITEFWRRWHISLSSWLRDYLYVPLGGNRHGHVRTYFNLAMVMLLGGLWHGAAWTFVVWGAIHGGLLAVERLLGYQPLGRVRRYIGIFFTFHLVAISWVFFRSPDFVSAMAFFSGMTDFSSMTVITAKFLAMKCILLVVLFVFIEIFSTNRIFFRLRRRPTLFAAVVLYAFLLSLLGNFSESPFIYFQF